MLLYPINKRSQFIDRFLMSRYQKLMYDQFATKFNLESKTQSNDTKKILNLIYNVISPQITSISILKWFQNCLILFFYYLWFRVRIETSLNNIYYSSSFFTFYVTGMFMDSNKMKKKIFFCAKMSKTQRQEDWKTQLNLWNTTSSDTNWCGHCDHVVMQPTTTLTMTLGKPKQVW
jgi:hypothetical protein